MKKLIIVFGIIMIGFIFQSCKDAGIAEVVNSKVEIINYNKGIGMTESCEITGQIKNTGSSNVNSVEITFSLYLGNVLVEMSSTTVFVGTDLTPGGIADFDAWFDLTDWSSVDRIHYDLEWTSGYSQFSLSGDL